MTLRSNDPRDLTFVLSAIPIPAAIALDRAGRDVRINAAFAELLGMSLADAFPFVDGGVETLSDRFEGERGPLHFEDVPLTRAARGETVTATNVRVRRADGTLRSLLGWASPLFPDGSVPGAICVFHDVSAREDAERCFRDLVEHAPALLFRSDPHGNVDFFNRRWKALTGASGARRPGQDWHSLVHPDDRDRAARAWARALEYGGLFDADVRLRDATGEYRSFQLRAECARDDAGTVRWYGTGFATESQQRGIAATRLPGSVPALADIASAPLGGFADVWFFDIAGPTGAQERHVGVAPGIDPEVVDLVRSLAPPVRAFRTDHPFARALARGEIALVERADDAWKRDAAASPEIERVWRRVGFHSVLSVPLRSPERPLGRLTVLRVRGARAFDGVDVGVAEDVARRSGSALERNTFDGASGDALTRQEEFRTLADVMPQLMWTADAGGHVDWRNRRWHEFTGLEPGNGGYGDAIVHPDERDALNERWATCRRTGEPFDMEHRIRRRDGTYRWFLTRATASRDAAGNVARWHGSATDIDDQRRASLTLQVFAKLGEVLSESLGLQPTLEAAMDVVVPEFADWAYVNLVSEAGDLNVQAIYHPDARTNGTLRGLLGERYARGTVRAGSGHVLRSREPYLYRHASYADAARVVEPAVLDALWAVGFHSVLVVPLVVGTTVRGTLNVVMNESRREFGSDDVPFFRELARRLAPAVANAEVYERERRVAQSFQRAALPADLPDRSGFTFHAIYEAGRAEALIGGDWYDAFSLVDGRIVLSIGDVAGSGLAAAVTMANMRQAIRGVAQVHADPALMLEAADRSLRSEAPDRFVTAFVGVLDGVGGTLSYASAGHPPPLVRRADGTIEELACGGPPLGLREHVRGGGHVYALPDDAFFVFYTDGLTESTHDLDEGERRLRAAVVSPHVVAAADPALAIYAAVLLEGSRDDVAILTVRVGSPDGVARWSFDALDAPAAHRTQFAVRERLTAMQMTGRHLIAAELVIAELIGNTVRYAPGPVEVVLERVNGRAVAHVLDRGPGFEFAAKLPPDIFSESGRGLFLIASFADDFHVVRRAGGGSHARVVLHH